MQSESEGSQYTLNTEANGGFDPAGLAPLSFAAIRARLCFTDIEARLNLPGPEPVPVAALGWLRGALGQYLMQRSDAEAVYCALFEDGGQLSRSLQLPKPYLLQFDQNERQVLLRLRLFAAAQDHAALLAEAMAKIMQLAPDAHPLRCAAVPLSVEIVPRGVAAIHAPEVFAMRFLTPLSQRNDQRTHAAPQAVLRGLFRRVSGIAALYGWCPDQPVRDVQNLLAERFSAAAWCGQDFALTSWQRGSARQDRRYKVEGVAGTLLLNAAPEELAPLFDLGVAVHAGAKATVGHGRYLLENQTAGREL